MFRWKKCITIDEYKHIESVRVESNITRMFLCIFLLLVFEALNILSLLLTDRHPVYGWGYMLSTIYLCVVAIIYLITTLCYVSRKDISAKAKTLYRSFWLLVSAGILLFNTFDILERGSLINFIIFLSTISLLPILDLKEITLLLLSALFYQLILIIYVDVGFEIFLQSLLFCFAVFLIAQALFISFVKSNIVHKKLESISETDPLTGLLNRRGLEMRLADFQKKKAIKQNRIAIAVLDVDHFKIYNDKLGHLEGDNCLKKIADCLRAVIDEKTNIICRFGGEEFVVLMQNIVDSDLLEVLLKIRCRIKDLNLESCNHATIPDITVSIGAFVFTCDGQALKFEELFDHADKELYHAKQNGRDIISLSGELFS